MRDSPRFTASLYYFLYFAALSCFAPFRGLYYRNLGLLEGQIGILVSLEPLVLLFGASFWSFLADLLRRHGRVLRLAMAGLMGSVLLLLLVRSFPLLLLVAFLIAFFSSPLIPLIDSSVMEMLGEDRDLYARLRLWGAVGWGIAAPLAGLLAGSVGIPAAFLFFVVLMSGCLLTSLRLPLERGDLEPAHLSDAKTLFTDSRLPLFLGTVLAAGVGMGAVHHFLFLYMDDLGAATATMGLSLSAATVGELLVFATAPFVLRRGGVRTLFVVSLAATALRLALMAVLNDPLWVLPVQMLHGFSFAAMLVAGVSYAQALAPRAFGATAQALFTGTYFGIGGGIAALAGGWIYQATDSHTLFGWTSALVACALVLFLFFGRRLGLRSEGA